MLRVENRHVKFFNGKILQSRAEDFLHIPRAADWNAVVAVFCRHSPSQLERRVNLDSTRVPYPAE
jgi:hypothetical protein